jgi:hypothetical protein
VNCLEFRRALGADPTHASAESLAHRAACAACEKYAQDMLLLNGLIKRALEIPVPKASAFVAPQPARQWYAMAASVLLMFGIIGAIAWFAYPRESLAREVVAHMRNELPSMTVTDRRVADNLLDGVLRAQGMRLARPMDDVSYLQSCAFRGGIVPHLVVQTERGPVTVLLLPKERIPAIQQFSDGPYRGMLVPLEHGGLAVISQDASVLETVTTKVRASIAWN